MRIKGRLVGKYLVIRGCVIDTRVGTQVLSTNTYDFYGKLSYVTYGNGYKTLYTYDSLDRVKEISEKANSSAAETKVCEFVYDGIDYETT